MKSDYSSFISDPLRIKQVNEKDIINSYKGLNDRQLSLLKLLTLEQEHLFTPELDLEDPLSHINSLVRLAKENKADNFCLVSPDQIGIKVISENDQWYKYRFGLTENLYWNADNKDKWLLKSENLDDLEKNRKVIFEHVNMYQKAHGLKEVKDPAEISFENYYSKDDVKAVYNYLSNCVRFLNDYKNEEVYRVDTDALNSFGNYHFYQKTNAIDYAKEYGEDLNKLRADVVKEVSNFCIDPLHYEHKYKHAIELTESFKKGADQDVFIDNDHEMGEILAKRTSAFYYGLLNKEEQKKSVIPLTSYDKLEPDVQDKFINGFMHCLQDESDTTGESINFNKFVDYAHKELDLPHFSKDDVINKFNEDHWKYMFKTIFSEHPEYLIDYDLSIVNIKTDLPQGCRYTVDGIDGKEYVASDKKSYHR